MAVIAVTISSLPGAAFANAASCGDRPVSAAPTPVAINDVNKFLDSLGVNTHIDQGVEGASYIAPLRYLGIRRVRDGSRNVASMISVARATGVRFALIAGGDLSVYLAAARAAAQTNALAAIEGPNEPNNFPITYKDVEGGGKSSWRPVAEFQRDLYSRVKSDPILAKYPVYGTSEVGAQTDNVGLQFLEIPKGANIAFPDGTKYADFVNVHNYVSAVHGGYADNQAWNAADPTLNGRWDGLAGNHGSTWGRHFKGYGDDELLSLPKVTTETGFDAGADMEEQRTQGVVLVNTYLSQFARGWTTTFIYELKDNEGGDSIQGLYAGDKPKLAATYIHNLTSLLNGKSGEPTAQARDISISTDSPNIHALNFSKPNGAKVLVVWGERASGTDAALLKFGKPTNTTVYDVTIGTQPVSQANNVTEQCLSLADHALVISYHD